MEKQYTSDWFSNNIPVWDQIFTETQFIGRENLRFLEIGCYEGRATTYLLENILTHPTSRIDVIDNFLGSPTESGMNWQFNDYKHIYANFMHNMRDYLDKINVYIGKSADILKTHMILANKYDFIYIDGSHFTYNVLEDAVLCHSLLNLYGIIIFDDYGWVDPNNTQPTNSPALGISSFCNCYSDYYRVFLNSYQVGVQKIK